MPGMPLHLEKGHALMALEDLLNNGAHHQLLRSMFDGLRDPVHSPLGELFSDGVRDPGAGAPILDHYGGNLEVGKYGGLGHYVASAWFGEKTDGKDPDQYWIDYTGEIDEVVREALLFTMEVAFGVTRAQPLPATRGADWRDIELFWHCAQRWFEAWVTWKPTQPVQLLFATPPHRGGPVHTSILDVVKLKFAEPTDPVTAQGRLRDMVVICQARHEEKGTAGATVGPSAKGKVTLPSLGGGFEGKGAVGAYSVNDRGGGSRPEFAWK